MLRGEGVAVKSSKLLNLLDFNENGYELWYGEFKVSIICERMRLVKGWGEGVAMTSSNILMRCKI